MRKRESTFTTMLSTLVLVSLVAALALGYVHKITKEPIRIAQEKKLKKALKVVLPDFKEIKKQTIAAIDEADSLVFYRAYLDSIPVGLAVHTYTNKGFSGHFEILVGFTPEGSIFNTAVLKHSETPGLGDKMDAKKSNFPMQFKGKNPETFRLKVKKDGGDVDAITAATISSRAFCDAVQRAYSSVKKEGGFKHE